MKGGILVRNWDTFKKIFCKWFQDMEEAKIYSKLTCLQQEGTLEEYFSNLLVLATRVQDITGEWLLRISIDGINIVFKVR